MAQAEERDRDRGRKDRQERCMYIVDETERGRIMTDCSEEGRTVNGAACLV